MSSVPSFRRTRSRSQRQNHTWLVEMVARFWMWFWHFLIFQIGVGAWSGNHRKTAWRRRHKWPPKCPTELFRLLELFCTVETFFHGFAALSTAFPSSMILRFHREILRLLWIMALLIALKSGWKLQRLDFPIKRRYRSYGSVEAWCTFSRIRQSHWKEKYRFHLLFSLFFESFNENSAVSISVELSFPYLQVLDSS